MYRVRSNSKKPSSTQNKKESSNSQFLIQNENEILKVKNTQLNSKYQVLKSQIYTRTQRISEAEKDCQMLRESLNNSYFVKDIELQSEKKSLFDRISLTKSNIEILKSKIDDSRNAVVFEESKVGSLINERHGFQEQLRIIKMQNQGVKKILTNLQIDNDKLRQLNADLSLKKYTYEPEQMIISSQIEQRLRLIKNINSVEESFKKQKSVPILANIIENILTGRKKEAILYVQKYSMKSAIIKKKLFMMSCIRKKYLDSVKARILSAFKTSIPYIQQEQKAIQIISNIKKRRQKAKIWRIWRNQTAKAEYALIRKYESQNSIQRICQTYMKSQMYFCFNRLKYNLSNHKMEIACHRIYNSISYGLKRYINEFMQICKKTMQKLSIESEIERSAEQHSKILVLGKYFKQWATHTRINKTVNLNIKFKYFKQLKKLLVLKKKNLLNQILGASKQKIRSVFILSQCFIALKNQKIQNQLEKLKEQQTNFNDKLVSTKQQLQGNKQFDILSNQALSLIKISAYLKKKTRLAFNIWRKQNRKLYFINKMVNIFKYKQKQSLNFAFSRIQKKKFEKLKLSIKDKIASCQYSYNYLVEQNTHIKQVLDKKSHELQKAKFITILKRIIRRQKQVKLTYFYKFFRNGFKCWKVRKSLERIDGLMNKKINQVLFFLLKLNKKESLHNEKIQNLILKHDEKQIQEFKKKSFLFFKQNAEKNKRLKRVLSGVFDRNLQLSFYQAFGKIRRQGYQYQLQQLNNYQEDTQKNIGNINEQIQTTEGQINTLTNRLKYKEQTLRQKKILSLYKFFSKNAQKNVGAYIWKWKNKVDHQKKVLKFVELLESKSSSIVKNKFLIALQKTKCQLQTNQLENRLDKFKGQYEKSIHQYDKFNVEFQEKSIKMKAENQQNQKITTKFVKITDHMNEIKVESFKRYWGKNIYKFVFREWKKQNHNFKTKIFKFANMLDKLMLRDGFDTISSEIKFQIVKDRIRSNLLAIYNKTYFQNAGTAFRIWRHVGILNKVKIHEQQLKQTTKGMKHIQQHYENMKKKYYSQVDYRIFKQKLRKITNAWRIYTESKLNNNQRKNKLEKWLKTGFSVDFIKLLSINREKLIKQKTKIQNFKIHVNESKAIIFFRYLQDVMIKKRTISRLFIDKFCFYQIQKLNEQFFTKMKNYYRQIDVNKTDRKCYCIQRVIETFQKKRKDILCQNMRIWRRNQYQMNIEKTLLKRLTRNAINKKGRDLFYAWKLERQARYMLYEHTQQGQVKKRKVQIKRLKHFLDEYKKQKGLLLQNEQGHYVVSPKFQQNKEKQVKKQNNLKYKFISRLILAMNGFYGPIKAYNNLQIYTKLRGQYRKSALMVKNRLQKPDLYTGFKIWQGTNLQLRNMFNSMQRKDLIRILNREKDKMQMQYSKKIEVQQKVQKQLRRYKILAYQQKRKERICCQILFKQARQVKANAWTAWRQRVQQLREDQANILEDRGTQKLTSMEEQVQALQADESRLQQHNGLLRQAVSQALQLAQMIKRLSSQRDSLRRDLAASDISCQSLQFENQQLNNKLVLAQKEAMHLLTLSAHTLQ